MLYMEGAAPGSALDPAVLRAGEQISVAFRASRVAGAMSVTSYEVAVFDARRKRVATLLRGRARAAAGLVCIDWNGRDDAGALVPPGAYQLRVQAAGSRIRIERTLLVD